MTALRELEAAARELMRVEDALRDARNGLGHPGEEHDRWLWRGDPKAEFQVYDLIGDCSACGGAQYGAEDEVHRASVALREVLGIELRPFEQPYSRAALDSEPLP